MRLGPITDVVFKAVLRIGNAVFGHQRVAKGFRKNGCGGDRGRDRVTLDNGLLRQWGLL